MDESLHIVWTLLSQQDFMHAGAEEQDLPDVIDELLSSSPHARVVVLLYETSTHDIAAIIRTERPIDAIALCAPFHAAGTREEVRLVFKDKNIVQTETLLMEHIKKELASKQN